MSYLRTLPRDLFNEANLLKCYGQLWLKLEGRVGPNLTFDFEDYDGQSFEIEQDSADGSTYLSNVTLFILGHRVSLRRPLNSRETWPLWVSASAIDDNLDDFEVFDTEGELSRNFLAFIGD